MLEEHTLIEFKTYMPSLSVAFYPVSHFSFLIGTARKLKKKYPNVVISITRVKRTELI